MIKPLFPLWLLLICAACTPGKIKKFSGVVRDIHSGAVVAGAEVYLPDLDVTLPTDTLGYFELRVGKSYLEKKGPHIKSLVVRRKNGAEIGRVSIPYNLTFQQVLVEDGQQGPPAPAPKKTADMHYHVSMKPHNEMGLELYYRAGRMDNQAIWALRHKKLKVLYDGKWKRPGKIRPIREGRLATSRKERRRYAKLKTLYEGTWLRPRTKGPNNTLYNYTQATLPHMRRGNVALAFNAISPFEHNLNNHWKKELISKFFKSGGKRKWFRKIGETDPVLKAPVMSHWKNYSNELDLMKKQDAGYNGTQWKFLTSGQELARDQTSRFIVNVLEGAHALHGPVFMAELYIEEEHDKQMFRQGQIEQRQRENQKVAREKEAVVKALGKNYPQFTPRPDPGNDPATADLNINDLIKLELAQNIRDLKAEKVAPVFMVTIAHLSWNGMVGHAPALDTKGIGRLFLRRFYRIKGSDERKVVNQWKNIHYSVPGFNDFGKFVVDSLVSENNGRRILIDLKHSDYATRKYFFDTVMPDKKIPPICSHCAVTGLPDEDYSRFVDEYALLNSSVDSLFYPFGLNLYNDEVAKICQGEGIIGITLEHRVLGGYMKPERAHFIRDFFACLQQDQARFAQLFGKALAYNQKEMGIANDEKSRQVLLKDYLSLDPFMQNLFYILDIAEGKAGQQGREAWKRVCIGSDLDGIIDPIDICPTAGQYPHMRQRMAQLIPFFLMLRQAKNPAAKGYEHYFADSSGGSRPTLEEALDALFYNSLRDFVVAHFKEAPGSR